MTTTTPKPLLPAKPRAQVVVGSVSERARVRKDGTAYVVYRAQYYSPDAAKIERTFSSLSYGTKRKAKSAAHDWLAKQRATIAAGTWVDPRLPSAPDPSRITVAEVADEWKATWERRRLRVKTRAGYRNILATHVLPRWGSTPVGQITSRGVNEWIGELEQSSAKPGKNHTAAKAKKRPLHPTTVASIYGVLRLTLRHAVGQGYIATNPCSRDAITLPSKRRRPGRRSVGKALTWGELRQLKDALPEEWRTPVALAVVTGLRAAELWGLTREDWDAEAATITVRHTLSDTTGGLLAAPTKTEASERTISVPQSLHAALTAAASAPGRALGDKPLPRGGDAKGYAAIVEDDDGEAELAYVPDADDPRRLLFTLPTGHPVRHNNFYRRVYRPIVDGLWPEGHKLHGARFHDLRHSHATNLLITTNSPTAVQKRMGHSQLSITTDLYGRHTHDAWDRLLADEIGAAWDGDELAAKRSQRQSAA